MVTSRENNNGSTTYTYFENDKEDKKMMRLKKLNSPFLAALMVCTFCL